MSNEAIEKSLGLGKYIKPEVTIDPSTNRMLTISTDIPQWLVEAVKMRERGCSFDEIAAEFQVSKDTLIKGYHRVMNDFRSDAPDAIIAAREASLARLDDQLRKMYEMQELMPENLKIVDKILAIETRRAKLQGLDAAEKVDARVVTASFEDQLRILDASYDEIN